MPKKSLKAPRGTSEPIATEGPSATEYSWTSLKVNIASSARHSNFFPPPAVNASTSRIKLLSLFTFPTRG